MEFIPQEEAASVFVSVSCLLVLYRCCGCGGQDGERLPGLTELTCGVSEVAPKELAQVAARLMRALNSCCCL